MYQEDSRLKDTLDRQADLADQRKRSREAKAKAKADRASQPKPKPKPKAKGPAWVPPAGLVDEDVEEDAAQDPADAGSLAGDDADDPASGGASSTSSGDDGEAAWANPPLATRETPPSSKASRGGVAAHRRVVTLAGVWVGRPRATRRERSPGARGRKGAEKRGRDDPEGSQSAQAGTPALARSASSSSEVFGDRLDEAEVELRGKKARKAEKAKKAKA